LSSAEFGGLLALFFGAPLVVLACRCQQPTPPPCEAYKSVDLVVTGRVTAVRPDPATNSVTATVTVLKSWKKRAPAEITVVTGDTCAYQFVVGREDLLYLFAGESGGYTTNRCFGNRAAKSAAKAIQWLNRCGKAF